MKSALMLLMPYAGHFFTNLPLIRRMASQGTRLLIYGSGRFREFLPAENVIVRDYPQSISEYCGNGGKWESDRDKAAYDYFSYMADSGKILLKEQIDDEMENIVLKEMRAESEAFEPDIIMYDTHAGFTAALRKTLSCPRVELNSSVYAPALWQSESFRDFYSEILRPSYSGDTSYEQIISMKRKRERKSRGGQERSFAYISPLLQDEKEKLSGACSFIGFDADIAPAEQRKGIYVSRGTVAESYGAFLLRDTLHGLDGFPADITASCGGNPLVIAALEEGGFSDNIKIRRYTDQKSMLAASRIFITHGGITGVREAISAHTPMIVIPANFPDYQTGRAVEKNHGGLMLRHRPIDREELQNCCIQILSRYDEYAAGVKKMAADLKSTWFEKGLPAIEKECERILCEG